MKKLLPLALTGLLLASATTAEAVSRTDYQYITPEEYDRLPEQMFEINVLSACQEGIRYNVTCEDPLMVYTNIVVDARYVFEDHLTDLDFAEQILSVSNSALETFGSWDAAQNAEFFYIGNQQIENAIVSAPGERRFIAVMGLQYHQDTNTVTPLTQVVCSDIFTYEEGYFPVEEGFAYMKNPRYIEKNGKNYVRVDVELNEGADEAYGYGFAPDHRDHNSDYEIISYLTSLSNMSETLIYPMYLDVEMAPGDQKLFALATSDSNGTPSRKLNWAIFEAPEQPGDPVKVLGAAENYASLILIPEDPNPGSHVQYYDLNGRLVSHPAPGIYIRRDGANVTKVVVRD